MVWLYIDTKDVHKSLRISKQRLLVSPSFISLFYQPTLIVKKRVGFLFKHGAIDAANCWVLFFVT